MPSPLDTSGFLARFPEFEEANPVLIDAKLTEAAHYFDEDLYGDLYPEAVGYLAAHLLSLSPFGTNARLDKTSDMTSYRANLDRLAALIPAGPLVIDHRCP